MLPITLPERWRLCWPEAVDSSGLWFRDDVEAVAPVQGLVLRHDHVVAVPFDPKLFAIHQVGVLLLLFHGEPVETPGRFHHFGKKTWFHSMSNGLAEKGQNQSSRRFVPSGHAAEKRRGTDEPAEFYQEEPPALQSRTQLGDLVGSSGQPAEINEGGGFRHDGAGHIGTVLLPDNVPARGRLHAGGQLLHDRRYLPWLVVGHGCSLCQQRSFGHGR
jgi:hypothetical protein